MNKKNAEKVIRERIRPTIFDFAYLTTRAHRKTFLEFKNRLKERKEPIQILDLGCGQKPFQVLLKDLRIKCYVGVDFDSNRSVPDIIAPIDDLPLSNDVFDAIIASEVFEHTLELEKAIREMKRVAKHEALAYISTPFMFGEHGAPYDFQRITRYKYFELFKNDEILILRETNTSLSTVFFLANLCWEFTVLKKIPVVTSLFYAFNNLSALLCEAAVKGLVVVGKRMFNKRQEWFRKIVQNQFYAMPGGYSLIIKINKAPK